MDPVILILAVLSGYLIGAISFSRLVTRVVSPETDLSNVEAKGTEDGEAIRFRHYGANTASIKLGARWGCLIGLLDILKVTIVVLVFRILFPFQYYFLIAAVAGMAGHIWPVYYRFKGGGGISAMYGGFLAVDPLGAIACAFAGLALGMVVLKDMMIAYLSGPWLMILWLWFRTHDLVYVAYAVIVNILFMLALIPEIRNYIRKRRAGIVDSEADMATFPMGRGMLKMMEKLHLSKK